MNKLFVAAAMIFTASIAQAGEYTIDLHCERAAEGNAFSQNTVKEFGWKCDGNDNPTIVETVKQENTIPVTDFNIRSQNAKIAKLEARIVKLEKMVKDLISNPVTTKPVEVTNKKIEYNNKTCVDMAGIAKLIMEKRQQGVSMADMLQLNKDLSYEALDWIVIDAYDTPRYTTDSIVQRTVTEFQNKRHLDCIKVNVK